MRHAIPGLLLAIVCLLPFWNKAFTIDDPVFLLESRQALRTPLNPTAMSLCWDAIAYQRPLRQIGPPAILTAYLLTPVILSGGKEWAGHLLMLILLCATVIVTAGLAFRCGATGRQATWSGLIFASTPVVLAMAGTVMPDIPATAFAAIGMERLMAWKDERRWPQAAVAGLALGLAPLARVHAIFLLPLGILILASDAARPSWRRIRQSRWTLWLPILIAVFCFVSLTWLTSDPVHASGTALFSGGPNGHQVRLSHIVPNLCEMGIVWMLTAPLGIVWLLLAGAAGLWALAAALSGGAVLQYGFHLAWGLSYAIGAAGLLAVGWALLSAWRSRGPFLWLALWLLIPLPLLPFFHFPCKYILLCAPAAAVLLACRLDLLEERRATLLGLLTIGAGATLGLSILRADSDLAGLARRVAVEEIAPRVSAGHRVWYSGQWALTWYAERAGASCFTLVPPVPARGDILVAGQLEGGMIPVTESGIRKSLLRTIRLDGSGLRLMNAAQDVGFYSNTYGHWPWKWSIAPVNVYYVWRVD